MPVSSKLKLKGGKGLEGISKKKKKKKPKKEEEEDPKKELNPACISIQSGKTYEEEFDIETKRANEAKSRRTAWGLNYVKPPKILHGYDKEVKGDTAEERLDIRCSQRTDKFCK